MLSDAELMAFASTSDLDRARAFFAGTLGLTLIEHTPFACVFDARGTRLRVTLAGEVVTVPYTVLGWVVAEIVDTVTGLGVRGVDFERFPGMDQDPLGIWTTPNGDRVAWFKDPDGNLLSLTQFAGPSEQAVEHDRRG